MTLRPMARRDADLRRLLRARGPAPHDTSCAPSTHTLARVVNLLAVLRKHPRTLARPAMRARMVFHTDSSHPRETLWVTIPVRKTPSWPRSWANFSL